MPKQERPSNSKAKKSSVPIVDSLATALRILDYFSIREPELSLSQLCEKSGLYKSRIHRLCNTLVESGYLIRTPYASYRLGPKLLTLGKIYEHSNSIISLARPVMRDLAHQLGESVALFSLDGNSSFCLAREYGTSRLVFSIQEGDYMQLHASAAGRVLLAYGPDDLRKKILDSDLESYTPETITDPARLEKELVLTKNHGYSINRGERELEVAAIAAPIFNFENKVEVTLAVVGPVQRFSKEREPVILKALFDAADRISRALGAHQ